MIFTKLEPKTDQQWINFAFGRFAESSYEQERFMNDSVQKRIEKINYLIEINYEFDRLSY